MTSPTKYTKAQYGSETRKKPNPISATLQALKQLAKDSFNDLGDDFTLTYIDGEGSSITMRNDEDVELWRQEFIERNQTPHFIIQAQAVPPLGLSSAPGADEFGLRVCPSSPRDVLNNLEKFQNREAEIDVIARCCLGNMKVLKLPVGSSNTHKLNMFTSAQMWGSGKSWLGNCFLGKLKQSDELLTTLRREFRPEHVDVLLETEYVQIDLRTCNCALYDLEECLKRAVLSSLLALPNTSDTVISRWMKQSVAGCSVSTIVQEFMQKRQRSFFFHFDEMDEIRSIRPAVSLNNQDEHVVERYYTFCAAMQSILRIRSFVYCSGRSAILYALGRGWFSHIPIVANVKLSNDLKVVAILLDCLKVPHIISLLEIEAAQKRITFLHQHCLSQTAGLIHQRTNGVPRLVEMAILFLAEKLKTNNKCTSQDIKTLLQNDFMEYLSVNASNEVNPTQLLQDTLKTTYVELVRVAALRIPLDLEQQVNPAALGLETTITAPLIELLQLLNVYVEKGSYELDHHRGVLGDFKTTSMIDFDDPEDKDYKLEDVDEEDSDEEGSDEDTTMQDSSKREFKREWFISFPAVVLEQIAQKVMDPRLPFWKCYYQNVSAESWGLGDALEVVTRNAICLRFMEQLGFEKVTTFGETLPLYEGSFFADEPAKLDEIQPVQAFVKISTHPSSPSQLDEDAKKDKLMDIRACLDNKQITECHPDWWADMAFCSLIPSNRILRSAPMSAAGDLLFYGATRGPSVSNRRSTQLQLKDGNQEITVALISKEAAKASTALPSCSTLTFVVLGFNIHKQILKRNDGTQIRDCALLFRHPSKFGDFNIPAEMEIIVVLREGMIQLLSKQNVEFFENRDPKDYLQFVKQYLPKPDMLFQGIKK